MVLTALGFMLVLTLGFYEARKAYWDYQVDKLCRQDGGVKINQVMFLDVQTYDKLIDKKFGTGSIVLPNKGSPESVGAVAVLAISTDYLKRNNPTVGKHVMSIVRTNDGVVLATSTSYGRGDGDLISLHPSGHSCPPRAQKGFSNLSSS